MLRGSPCEQFFDTMITSQDMDEIDLFGEKLSKKSETVYIFYPSPSIELPLTHYLNLNPLSEP